MCKILVALFLVMMLSPIVTAERTFVTESTTTGMHKTEDIFRGSFSPKEKVAVSGETFDVTFSVCPIVDAPNTVIKFVLPADLVKLVSGAKAWTGDLKKGETLSLTLSLAANGEVEACVKADVEACLSGKDYRSSYYLQVATLNYGFGSTAASGSMEPGSLRQVNLEYVSKTSNPASYRNTENSTVPLAFGNIEVKGQFWFVDENGSWSVARYMQVRLRDNVLSSEATQWTDKDGKFDFVVANTWPLGRSPILDLIAEGEWDWISTSDSLFGLPYWWTTGVLGNFVPDGWVYENNNLGVNSNTEALQAGDAVFLEAEWVSVNSGVSWRRPRVIIRFPNGDWPHSHGDLIDLPLKSTAGWNHATVQHESGHAIMWTLYGDSWPDGAIFGSHTITMEWSNMPAAFAEGFADFMEAVVDNDPNNLAGGGHNIETNDWFNHQDTGDMDGAYIEGSIASILWDIWDPVNIAGDDDHMAWGYEEIFTVLRYGDAGADDNPNSIHEFWDDWASRWPTNSTSMGPLCDIYYNYGIDKDWYNPWGSIIINSGATYTTSRTVTLTLSADDWGSGAIYMRFSEDKGVTWSDWYAYSATFSYTMKAGDGSKRIDVQYGDFYWMSKGGTIYDGIWLDTVKPTGSIIIGSGNPTYTTTTSVTLYLTYADATSGVYQVRYGNAGGTWGAWEAPNATKAWTLSSGDGNKGVYYEVKDNAGNTQQFYDGIVLDTMQHPIVKTWFWSGNTTINSVAAADVDADGQVEIVTGGYYHDGARNVAQLVVWTGSGLAVDRLTTWYWTGNTVINSVAIGDVDGDNQTEIVTGGTYFDGTRNVAQLVVWSGSSLAAERIKTWYWTSNTVINSVAIGDVDGDAQVEIVSGGYYNDGTRNRAQLVVWKGSDLSVDRLTDWYWTGNTVINSVALGDVDADSQAEIATGGYYYDGTRNVAQLVVWTGSSLTVDRLTSWYWTSNTQINSVAIGHVDADGLTEIVTGGYYYDGTRNVAQLVVWTGSTLAVDRLTTWYWTGNTVINSVALGDADDDGQMEIVTGGYYNDGTRSVAQMVSWWGLSLAAENVKTWYWVGNTVINSVCVRDVNGDALKETVTAGAYHDGSRWNAQLVVWT